MSCRPGFAQCTCYEPAEQKKIKSHLYSLFSHFLTCSQDRDIHVFDTKINQIEHIRCADQYYCLAVHNYHICAETNRNDIELEVRSYPHDDLSSSLVHFAQPVSALCLSTSSLFVRTRRFQSSDDESE